MSVGNRVINNETINELLGKGLHKGSFFVYNGSVNIIPTRIVTYL